MNTYEENAIVFCISMSLIFWTYIPAQVDQFRYLCYIIIVVGIFTIPLYPYYLDEDKIKKLAAVQYHKYREQAREEQKEKKAHWESLAGRYIKRT